MENYSNFSSDDNLHITSGVGTSILEIASKIQTLFAGIGKAVSVVPGTSRDEVQKDARNEADPHIKSWWRPQTTIDEGLAKVFNEMKKEYS
jgi:nucleoside-diphosphate-sugar epimerase